MFNAIGVFFRIIFFSTVVLVLGNWLHWGGRTVSDQVRIGMAHAERSDLFHKVQNWANHITQDARKGFQIAPFSGNSKGSSPLSDEITSSERAKLRALIQELNSSHGKN
jgi:hypothetical protein